MQEIIERELVVHLAQRAVEHLRPRGTAAIDVAALAAQTLMKLTHQHAGLWIATLGTGRGQNRVAEEIVVRQPHHVAGHLVARLSVVLLA